MKLALIDADILVYRVGFTTQDKDEGIAIWRLDDAIGRILDTLKTITYRAYLTSTDRSNFRFDLFPEYKANRTQPKPVHYVALRDWLITKHAAYVVKGMEADDQLGIDQTPDSVICTIDKDLDQIPGWHFNFVTGRLYTISDLEATRVFYDQCLVGDKSTDNIEGCPGIGKIKANRMLEGCQTAEEMLHVVVEQYVNAYPKEWADKLMLAGSLLWIRKEPDEKWHINGSQVSKVSLEAFWNKMTFRSSTSHDVLSSLSLKQSATTSLTSK